MQLSVTLRDSDGAVISGRPVDWSTSDAGRASVSDGGLVSAIDPGRVTITAASEGRSGTAIVVVEAGALDFAIADAQFTQGVQAADGSISMVLQGSAAVVNVLVRSSPANASTTPIVLRIHDAATQALVHADTVLTSTARTDPTFAAPSAQFLVPAALLRDGLMWQVERDPAGSLPDDSAANDVYPRSGLASLATIDVPTLRIRFVPIVLASHGNARGDVSAANLPEYLRTLRSVMPVGRIDVEIGTPFTSSASFGSPPRGGEASFWTRVLAELDLARIADVAAPDAHWYGVVRPPSGFNFTEYGGFAYIPSSGSSTGANTRTALGVMVGWFSRPTQARDLVAHELAHNFGRRHAPCGGAAGTDADYPVAGGIIDEPGHDVYAWENAIATFAETVPVSTGDVMGYCFPVWASTYTHDGVRAFRGTIAEPPPITNVLVVRGHVTDGSGIRLEPAFTLEARPSLPEGSGRYQLEGLAADGTVMFAYAFEPAVLDHAPDVRAFTLAIPATPELERTLQTLLVRGPAGEAAMSRHDLPAGVLSAAPAPPSVMHEAMGMVRVTCGEGVRGVLVRHAGGGVLGTSTGSAAVMAADPGTTLDVACSDGVRTHRYRAIVP